MFIKNQSKLLLLLLAFTLLAPIANALKNGKERLNIEVFLKEGDFSIQRSLVKDQETGQKGLSINKKSTNTVKDLVEVDLIDPFVNKQVMTNVKFNSVNINKNDENNQYEDKVKKQLDLLEDKIEKALKKIESSDEVNMVALLNYLQIDRIISSPEKYVVIYGKKYEEGSIISVKINHDTDKTKLLEIVDSINITSDDITVQEELSRIRQDAMTRYDNIIRSGAVNRNLVIEISLDTITKDFLELSSEGKTYKIVAK